MATKKFRPYFSPEELKLIISSLKEKPTPERIALSRYLEHYSLKIDSGLFQPAITLKPSLEEQLELSPEHKPNPARASSLRLQAFLKWEKNPSACTPKELLLVNEYRYENNLMSPEEETAWEIHIGIGA